MDVMKRSQPSAHHDRLCCQVRDFVVPGGENVTMQTRTRRTLWDKMHLAKDIERPSREWDKVER
jgi:hypothetical protein